MFNFSSDLLGQNVDKSKDSDNLWLQRCNTLTVNATLLVFDFYRNFFLQSTFTHQSIFIPAWLTCLVGTGSNVPAFLRL